MKYAIILMDGMADYPVPELAGKTPMEVAKKPNIDNMAKSAEVFKVQTIADGYKPGSDVANLAVMGYNVADCYTGRSPLEAASIGVSLKDNEMSFRANLVSLSGEGEYEDLTMLDYSSGEITTAEAEQLINAINENLKIDGIKFYSGTSYRHLIVWENAPAEFKLTPPHDISGRPVKDYLPSEKLLLDIMKKSREILKNHPVNISRREKGLHTADSLWIWGEGKKPGLSNFFQTYGKKGAVISAVDLVKGIGFLAGMEVVKVDNVTGNIDTNFDGKAEAAISALKRNDLVYVHLEAPDECGHRGEAHNKVLSIELIDQKIVEPIKEALDKSGENYKIMIMPDHPTPIITKTHASDPVPCMIYEKGRERSGVESFTEQNAGEKVFSPGYKIMGYLLEKEEAVF